MFSLVIILFILIGRRAKGWVWGRNFIVGNWKMVNDIIGHERRSKVLTSQSRHAAKRNLFSFIVDSADYVSALSPILDNLTGIYSWLFIDVLNLLPPEWSITVCKVNVQCPLTSPPPPHLVAYTLTISQVYWYLLIIHWCSNPPYPWMKHHFLQG